MSVTVVVPRTDRRFEIEALVAICGGPPWPVRFLVDTGAVRSHLPWGVVPPDFPLRVIGGSRKFNRTSVPVGHVRCHLFIPGAQSTERELDAVFRAPTERTLGGLIGYDLIEELVLGHTTARLVLGPPRVASAAASLSVWDLDEVPPAPQALRDGPCRCAITWEVPNPHEQTDLEINNARIPDPPDRGPAHGSLQRAQRC